MSQTPFDTPFLTMTTNENDIEKLDRLEGYLSPSHVRQIRRESLSIADYIKRLESEAEASAKAIKSTLEILGNR